MKRRTLLTASAAGALAGALSATTAHAAPRAFTSTAADDPVRRIARTLDSDPPQLSRGDGWVHARLTLPDAPVPLGIDVAADTRRPPTGIAYLLPGGGLGGAVGGGAGGSRHAVHPEPTATAPSSSGHLATLQLVPPSSQCPDEARSARLSALGVLGVEEWRTVTADALMPTAFTFPDPGSFTADLVAMQCGDVQVSAMRYAPLHSRRTPRLIRRSDPELVQVGLVRHGQQGIEQARRNVLVRPGGFVVYDSSRPFHAFVGPDGGPNPSLVLQVPRGVLHVPQNSVDARCATVVSGAAGPGRLLRQFLRGLAEEYEGCTAHDRQLLGESVTVLVTALLAQYEPGDDGSVVPAESRARHLYLSAVRFVADHLSDPELTPDAVAHRHHVSLRYLQRVFQAEGTSVRAHIRRTRLRHCARDLADPAQARVAVGVIAHRWGFPQHAQFTRAFRNERGESPSEFRARALGLLSGRA
jgi:AraC-like DNA-binding protein